jgi:general secretion pathway protein E
MMLTNSDSSNPQKDAKLSIHQVLHWLQEDNLISASNYEKCQHYGTHSKSYNKHPLNVLIECGVTDKTQFNKHFTLEELTRWLAKKGAAVTLIYSHSYALNYKILPIHVSKDEVIITTAEPYIRSWEVDVAKIQTGQIKRVLANPDEITRYLGEFYAFAKLLKGATDNSANKASNTIYKFEQLIELGKATDFASRLKLWRFKKNPLSH